jgi:hypothetical protein
MVSTHEISEMIIVAKGSKSVINMPSQIIHILDGLNELVGGLEQRVAKLEGGNILDDSNVLTNPNILK